MFRSRAFDFGQRAKSNSAHLIIFRSRSYSPALAFRSHAFDFGERAKPYCTLSSPRPNGAGYSSSGAFVCARCLRLGARRMAPGHLRAVQILLIVENALVQKPRRLYRVGLIWI